MISAQIREEEYEATERLTYQIALRAVGAWLDASGAGSDIRILETTDGFMVQQATPESTGVESSQTISFDRVWHLSGDKKYRKRSKEKDGGYQNLLRAVGFELDQADAHDILLEQIGEELLLTYVYPRYQGGFSVIKQFTVIAPDARQDLIRAAQERRKPGKIVRGLNRLVAEG
jgi:hypothetical protein